MNYYNPYQNYNQNYNPYQSQLQQQPQNIRSGSLVSVSSEEEARMYPVGPGNSVTFKNENMPYIYTKTMGFSQLDRPTFEKYKLVKEETPEYSSLAQQPQYASKDELTEVINKVMDLQEEIIALKGEDKKRESEAI